MGTMTRQMKQTMRVIERFWAKNGHSPALKDIAASLGKSYSATWQRILSLRAAGYIGGKPQTRSYYPILRKAE